MTINHRILYEYKRYSTLEFQFYFKSINFRHSFYIKDFLELGQSKLILKNSLFKFHYLCTKIQEQFRKTKDIIKSKLNLIGMIWNKYTSDIYHEFKQNKQSSYQILAKKILNFKIEKKDEIILNFFKQRLHDYAQRRSRLTTNWEEIQQSLFVEIEKNRQKSKKAKSSQKIAELIPSKKETAESTNKKDTKSNNEKKIFEKFIFIPTKEEIKTLIFESISKEIEIENQKKELNI